MSLLRDPEGYGCGYCGARPGKPCTTDQGRRTDPHKSRMLKARRRKKKEKVPWAGELLPDGATRRDDKGRIPPQLPDVWRAAFLRSTLRTGFCLALSQPMLEMLCAVATGFEWDRSVFRHSMGAACPDNVLATTGGLERRGLIRHRGSNTLIAEEKARSRREREARFVQHMCDAWELTPAGEAVVRLLRVTGVFLEPSASVDARGRAARAR